MGSEGEIVRKPRFLCIHGFRTSGEILKKQLGKWPDDVLQKSTLSLSMVLFRPKANPTSKEFSILLTTNGSNSTSVNDKRRFAGAILSAGLPGLQAQGVALTKVPKIKFLIVIGGAKFKALSVAEKAYSSPIQCPSLHFLGETDFLKPFGKELLESCVDPVVIHHPKGHTVPKLDEKSAQTVESFFERIQKMLSSEEEE
ncbi:hypothetical protein SLA2020_336160 [Shorea laevis]